MIHTYDPDWLAVRELQSALAEQLTLCRTDLAGMRDAIAFILADLYSDTELPDDDYRAFAEHINAACQVYFNS